MLDELSSHDVVTLAPTTQQIIAAYQINAFIRSGNPYVADLTANTHRAVRYFLATFPRPAELPPDTVDEPSSTRQTRASSTPTDIPRYPPDWVVDKHRFLTDINQWRVSLEQDAIVPVNFEPTPNNSRHESPSTNNNMANNAAGNFSEAQRTEMANIIAQAMTIM